MQKPLENQQKGAALAMVMQLSVVGALMVGAIAYMVTSQNKFNLRTIRSEQSLWMAETGAQRFLAGLKSQNDCISFGITQANPGSSCTGYWLNSWIAIRDESNKTIGEYRVSLLPSTSANIKRIKAEGKVYTSKQGSVEVNMVKRVIGMEYQKSTMDNFAIASNHQMGGARINGGARIYGGVFTAGRLGLDASSTGIYNDHHDLDDAQNFAGYPAPTGPPQGEVYVYKDNITNPPPNPNGGIELASQADLGTNTHPFKGVHTDSSVTDPGVGTPLDPVTVGDSVVGNGEGTQVHADKRDHDLPNVNFPDASTGSQYMQERLAEATLNGCVRGTSGAPSNLVLGNSTIANPAGAGCGAKFTYTVSGGTATLHIQGPVFIWGNVSSSRAVVYTGKGAIFASGDATFPEGLEPATATDYPHAAALGVVSSGNISLGENSGSTTKYAATFFGHQSISVQKAKIYGNIFGGTVNLPTTGTRPDIYVHPEVRSQVGVPMPDWSNTRIRMANWWEMHSGAAK